MLACALFFGAASRASAQEADLAIVQSGPGSAAANTNVAYTLNLDVAFVALHHLVRLAIVIFGAQIVFSRLKK